MSPVETVSGQSTNGALASSLETIVCTSEQICVAAAGQDDSAPGGALVALSTDGGAHWATTPPLAGVTQLNAMACTTSTSCIAVGWNAVGNDQAGVVLQTFDGGHTWRIGPALPKGVGILHSVSCPTPTYCMVVGSSTDGTFGVALSTSTMGSQWSSLSLPESQRALSLVTCTTPGDCIVEGNQGSNSGRSEFRGAAQHSDYSRRRIDLGAKRLACGRTYRCSELQGLGVLDPDALLSRRRRHSW